MNSTDTDTSAGNQPAPAAIPEGYQPEPGVLSGRIIVITGATGGLGSALSKHCARVGATVVLAGRNLQALESLYDEIENETGLQPAIYPINLEGATQHDYYEMAMTLEKEFGGLDGLVHCAAEIGQPTPSEHYPVETWSSVMAVNLHAPFLMTRALLPLLDKQGLASVVFTVDDKSGAFWGAYGVSKAAVSTYARILADEIEGRKNANGQPRVAVNRINPGRMRTRLRRKSFAGELPSESPEPETRTDAFIYVLARENPTLHDRLIRLPD